MEGQYELGIDSVSAVNVEDVSDTSALGTPHYILEQTLSDICCREGPYRGHSVAETASAIGQIHIDDGRVVM